MKRIILVAVFAVLAFASCKKESNNQEEPQQSVLEYFPLEIGNYWVYEKAGCDSTWENCNSISIDTNTITKDTVINGFTYFKLEGKQLLSDTPVFLRDSSNYLVTDNGNIYLSIADFNVISDTNYLIIRPGDTLYYSYHQMINHPNNIQVPAGSFDCIDHKLSIFRKADNFNIEYNTHKMFAPNIGLVYENAMYIGGLGGLKRELKSYNFIIITQ